MKVRTFFLILIIIALSTPAVAAADLSKVDRTIHKEPAYRSRPRYCLLVFGPQAKSRVWLVQDGDTLYVDRNGNGDLTEPGEKVAADKGDGREEDEYAFKAGDIRDGPRLHKDLTVYVSKLARLADQDESVKALVSKRPDARGYRVFVEMELPGWKGTGVGGRVEQSAFVWDAKGLLQFAERPQDAPVIHFGGPWQISLFGPHRLTVGRETDVVLGVGTPGLGAGTTAWVDYEGVIPEKVYPTVEITYPPTESGGPPVRERYELKRRC
jgi:hypothetical protein